MRRHCTIASSLSACSEKRYRAFPDRARAFRIMGVPPRSRPHAIVVPFPVQGHINPMMILAQNLASHGFIVTFINSEYNHNRIHGRAKSIEEEDTVAGGMIRLRIIPDGLPEEDTRTNFARLASATEKTMGPLLHKLIHEINESEEHKVTCLIADFFASWALDVAQQCQINARAAFWPGLIATYAIIHHMPSLISGGTIASDGIPKEHKMIRYLSSMPALCSAHLPWVIGSEEDQRSRFQFWLRGVARFRQVQWILCNTFDELEGPIMNMFPREAGICPVGPLIPAPSANGSDHVLKISKHVSFWAERHECLQWLDQQSRHSVIYVSFGSNVHCNERQVEEFALALEATQRPFLWVVRPDLIGNRSNRGLPGGYLERLGNRGCIISWAPQRAVLSHPSVACFLTHCGWNSIVESIISGVPMLCCPSVADQFLNSCYVVDVWKVGLALIKSNGSENSVEKSEIEWCVRRMMSGGEGVEIRKRIIKLKESARAALKTGGSSAANFHEFLTAMRRGTHEYH
jgi:hypothetical protein